MATRSIFHLCLGGFDASGGMDPLDFPRCGITHSQRNFASSSAALPFPPRPLASLAPAPSSEDDSRRCRPAVVFLSGEGGGCERRSAREGQTT